MNQSILLNAVFFTSIAAVLYAGAKLLLRKRKRLVREFVLYSAMTIWTGYIFGANMFKWPIVTPVTLLESVIQPLGRALGVSAQ
ncbi:hypothetical protein [Paenibacillus sp. NEAU-GSW1]|uniref:hypothetical protein n=1 Tax=Paenibacillus sp. NEAU-GSW1 TaxID=2682486 RepID=UPI0012E2BC34|nr:hypothetical protein [Paenibacillus sp. NEAU-GSW1]MUT64502.1 hypothetical protein [Paenibacillus sp. NEAU-GSW1]